MMSTSPISLLFGLYVLNSVSSLTFIRNVPGALSTLAAAASASASVSTPFEPYTNIADLRRKHQKAEQLQMEKELVEDNEDVSPEDEEIDEQHNEATPNVLQKKISKILAKIRILSSISNAVKANYNDEEEEDKEEETEPSIKDIESTTSSAEKQDKPSTFQKVIYPDPKYGGPTKVKLDINDRDVEEITVKNFNRRKLERQKDQMSKLGQIGVFFAELLGSIVGLVYGAAAHINNSVQGAEPSTAI